MKITEEIWNENSYDVERFVHQNSEVNKSYYYLKVMSKITKKVVLRINVGQKITTKEGISMFNNYILGTEFLNKYNLTTGFNSLFGRVLEIENPKTINIYSRYDLSSVNSVTINFHKNTEYEKYPIILFGDDFIIPLEINSCLGKKDTSNSIWIYEIYYTSDKCDIIKSILEDLCNFALTLPKLESKRDEIKLEFAYRNGIGEIDTRTRFVKTNDIQLDQFNDSLPHEKIVDILNKDEAGLILLHGEPGCGKSSYIRYLVKSCKNINFIIISQDLLQNMDAFREFLLDRSNNSVLIIEDCENLVKSRERVGSSMLISDFLNMTDGIYGDLFRLKFILTFNTEIQTIDQALLRKGRLKCKYKFNKLKGERLKKMAEKIGLKLTETQIDSGLSLADLFNYDEDNGGKQKETVRIGFNK